MNFRIIPLEERIVLDAAGAIEILRSFHVEKTAFEHEHHVETNPSDKLIHADKVSDKILEKTQAFDTKDSKLTEMIDGKTAPPSNDIHLLVISSDVKDYLILKAAASDPAHTIFYNPAETTLGQLLGRISSVLHGEKASSIGFASEGVAGGFNLVKDVTVTAMNLETQPGLSAFWQVLGTHVKDNGRIDLLACNVASTDAGVKLVSEIDSLVDHGSHKVSVAASTDITANAPVGNWQLEVGGIAADRVYFQADKLSSWDGKLNGEIVLPIANPDLIPVSKNNISAAFNVTANDTEGTFAFSVVSNTAPAHGSLSRPGQSLATFQYTPDLGFTGSDSFTYTIEDAQHNDSTATVTLHVTNDVPVANNDTINGDNTTVLHGNIVTNDTDANRDSLTPTVVSEDLHGGSYQLATDGTIDYTPAAGFIGDASLVYTVNDGTVNSSQATVTFHVTGNAPPVAVADSYTTDEDTSLTIAAPGVLANDTDPEGDALTAVLLSQPDNGSVALDANGALVYTPNANFNGTDGFNYQAMDSHGNLSDPVSVTLTVNPVADNPIATPGSAEIPEDTQLNDNVMNFVNNVDGNPLTAEVVAGPKDGSGNPSGTLDFNPDGTFTYTPEANFNGEITFTYKVTDPLESTASDVTPYVITIDPVNDAPVAVDDHYSTNEDQPLTINLPGLGVLANDSDVEGDTLHAVLDSSPQHGTVVLNDDGTFVYTPDQNYNKDSTAAGEDTFAYHVTDGINHSDPATVHISVTPLNDPLIAVNDSVHGFPNDITIIAVQANDTNIDGHSQLVFTQPEHGTVDFSNKNPLKLVYTPDPGFTGTDTFTYHIENIYGVSSNEATVTLTISNDPPVAVNDSYVIPVDGTLATDSSNGVLANDSDPEGSAITATLVDGPSHGTLDSLNPDGSFNYTPNAGFHGVDTFTYVANDGVNDSSLATVTITMDTAPTADESNKSTNSNTPLSGNVNAADVDHDPLTIALGTEAKDQPTHGTVVLNPDGSYTYTPDHNYVGTNDGFGCTVNDGFTKSSFRIHIDILNQPPVANNDTVAVVENHPIVINPVDLLANDTDPESQSLSDFTIVNSPTHGTINFDRATGYTYTPDAGFTGIDSFTYTMKDTFAAVSNEATVSIHVIAGNSAPVATSDSVAVNEDNALNGNLHVSDADHDPLTYVLNQSTSHGTVVLHSDGTFTYVPNHDFNGTDSFRFHANDGQADSNVATVSIIVNPVNDAPVALNDSARTTSGHSIDIPVLANDHDVDSAALTAMLIRNPLHGSVTVNSDGSLSYHPVNGFAGVDSFTYKANDGQALSNEATVTIQVDSASAAPVITLDTTPIKYIENQGAKIISTHVGVSDSDTAIFNGGILTIKLANGTASDSLSFVKEKGVFKAVDHVLYVMIAQKWTGVGSYSGGSGTDPLVATFNDKASAAIVSKVAQHAGFSNSSDNPSTIPRSVQYQLSDGQGGVSALASKTINVSSVNDAPHILVADSTVNASANVFSPIGARAGLHIQDVDSLSETVVFSVAKGQLTLSSFSGLGSLTYSIKNGGRDLILSGSIADVNAAVSRLMYKGSSGTVNLVMRVTDSNNSTIGTPLTVWKGITINVR